MNRKKTETEKEREREKMTGDMWPFNFRHAFWLSVLFLTMKGQQIQAFRGRERVSPSKISVFCLIAAVAWHGVALLISAQNAVFHCVALVTSFIV